MVPDQRPKIGANAIRPFESGGHRHSLLFFIGHIRALGEMLQITVGAERKEVPTGSTGSGEDQVLRPVDALELVVLHSALLEQLTPLSGESHKHLHVQESRSLEHLMHFPALRTAHQ